MSTRAENTLRALLETAGIRIGGQRPFDITVNDPRFYGRVLGQGSLGLGEAYMDGWWDCPALDQFFQRVFEAGLERRVRRSPRALTLAAGHYLLNLQSRRRAFAIGERHYDVGNDLFERMLDTRMVYSCGYWADIHEPDPDDLDAAQEAKLDLICRKLGLKSGMRVLDIGCGWGSLAQYAAERYGVEAVGVTVSKEQAALARERCAGLPVEIRLCDYREVAEEFDAIASVGMVEHVGWRNYRTYMKVAHRCLKPGGLFLLHTIGSNVSVKATDPWISRYIFPNSHLPSLAQLHRAAEGLLFAEDLHNFGPHYDHTLMAWHANFARAWPELAERYGERFGRMWTYYLRSCAAAFRVRRIQLWQILLAKSPRPRPVDTVR